MKPVRALAFVIMIAGALLPVAAASAQVAAPPCVEGQTCPTPPCTPGADCPIPTQPIPSTTVTSTTLATTTTVLETTTTADQTPTTESEVGSPTTPDTVTTVGNDQGGVVGTAATNRPGSPAASGAVLARTGSDATFPTIVGISLLMIGAVLLAFSRRRHTA